MDGKTLNYLKGQQLWQAVIHTTASALSSGALHSIPTRSLVQRERLGNLDLDFQIRVVENLVRKSEEMKRRAAQAPAAKDFNPFLPYDPNLYVGELTDHYRCLLNKFNVMEHHILMVTNRFVTQLEPLNQDDFLAAQLCLEAHEGLVFYNGGAAAGASITHKHLQMVPMPLTQASPFPFHQLLTAGDLAPGEIVSSALPFPHRVTATAWSDDTENCALRNWQHYREMTRQLSLLPDDEGLSLPHNLLLTRDRLWVVPRRCERHEGLAVNALGFAGTLLVKNDQQLQALQEMGCLSVLKAVAQPDVPRG
ncbi:MAG: phosphorylase [Gammaproteobacteria bacterium]|nr:MAG: phosphorylase [Gammaproteobacteria bacterium]